jgi:low affinity Fe/Cu permease
MTKNQQTEPQPHWLDSITNKVTTWMGSTNSIICHTIFFIVSFLSVALGLLPLNTMLLVLTTLVSLEAIYLAIFIQRSVNLQSATIVEEFDDLEEAISEDIDETEKALMKDLDETEKNISDDIDETEKAIFEDLDQTEAAISDDIDETERGIVKKTPKVMEKPLDEIIEELRKVVREEVKAALKEKK